MIKAQRSGTLLFGLYRKSVNSKMKDALFLDHLGWLVYFSDKEKK